MAREFKEKAHLNIDKKKFDENFDRIFGKKEKKPVIPTKESPAKDENSNNSHDNNTIND